jgi:uncharacterized OB-fold protein
VSEPKQAAVEEPAFGDPMTAPFWTAARQHKLLIQRCNACGSHQFYPRPMCLKCSSLDLAWVPSCGTGTVYSMTTVRVPVTADLSPPYVVALVDLDEGPRLLTNLVNQSFRIGDRVRVQWRAREPLPPVPVFGHIEGDTR